MPYREKVIKALEDALMERKSQGYYSVQVSFEVVDVILTLLKEQEAVPITQREVMHMLVWCCGSCGVAVTDGDKFCRMCGKELKWE